jgi:hypothetical protein
MRHRLLLAFALTGFLWAAAPALGETAELRVFVMDEDEHDWITLSHAGGCGIVSGQLRVDFGPSAGGVVIDTAYGGGGTRDPSPVAVLSGPVVAVPVTDGARHIDLLVTGLGPGGQAVVTLDIDNERGWFENARVMATPDDIMGSVATFTPGDDAGPATRAEFNDGRLAMMQVPAPCDDGKAEPFAAPIS